ncbi:hypothetical protein BsWGS_14425 [Bradybaena similaris]
MDIFLALSLYCHSLYVSVSLLPVCLSLFLPSPPPRHLSLSSLFCIPLFLPLSLPCSLFHLSLSSCLSLALFHLSFPCPSASDSSPVCPHISLSLFHLSPRLSLSPPLSLSSTGLSPLSHFHLLISYISPVSPPGLFPVSPLPALSLSFSLSTLSLFIIIILLSQKRRIEQRS